MAAIRSDGPTGGRRGPNRCSRASTEVQLGCVSEGLVGGDDLAALEGQHHLGKFALANRFSGRDVESWYGST